MIKYALWLVISIVFLATFVFKKILNFKSSEKDKKILDNIAFEIPSVAIEEIQAQTIRMFDMSIDNIMKAMQLFQSYKILRTDIINTCENNINYLERQLSKYIKLWINDDKLSQSERLNTTKIYLTIGNIEVLGNYAVKLSKIYNKMDYMNIDFSQEDKGSLYVLMLSINELLQITRNAYKDNDIDLLQKIQPLKDVIKDIIHNMNILIINNLGLHRISKDIHSLLSCILDDLENIITLCNTIYKNIIELTNDDNIKKYCKEQNKNYSSIYSIYKDKYSLKFLF